jgi:hypothetical protein
MYGDGVELEGPRRQTPVAAGLVVFLVLATAVLAQEEASPGIDRLAFLAGCWQGELDGGTTIRETYTTPDGGMILGNGQIVGGGATRFFEFSRISEEDGGVVYRPYPAGRESVAFPLVTVTATEAVFENPEHDHPQRIVYRAVDGGLVARVENLDGSRSQELAMRAVPCGGGRHRAALAYDSR